jgi:hypothetical protein
MNLETKITIYKFTPQLFTLTQNYRELFSCLLFLTNKFCYTLVYIIKRTYICHTERDEKRAALVGLGNSSN